MRIGSVMLGALALGRCVSATGGEGEEQLVGHYSQGFEVESFRPCGSEERWWVTGGEELRARYRALSPKDYEEVYVELRGRTGPPGQYGHMGAYTRELEAGKVLEMRRAGAQDCG